MGKILPGPWTEQQKEQKSFLNSSKDSSQDLCFFSTEIPQALQRVSTPFKTNSDICPAHCKEALKVLGCIHEELAIICQKHRQNASLTAMLSPSRYSLLIDLYRIQEDASRLMEQLDDYRISCLKSSRHLQSRRCEIMALFDKIIPRLKSIPKLLVSLEEDMEEQEQRLCTVIEQKIPIISPPEPYSFEKHIAHRK